MDPKEQELSLDRYAQDGYTISDVEPLDPDNIKGYFQLNDHIICLKTKPNRRIRVFAKILGMSWHDC